MGMANALNQAIGGVTGAVMEMPLQNAMINYYNRSANASLVPSVTNAMDANRGIF